mmetsp:Transcript_1342/g.3044  ORF Transcript_1342/g.3044 Transcript_1342/m.3044 type:complete len:525 (+) Transcript_1342:177-1751(+)|eukprot:CAMPEP_0177719986 /NCGR_PEP_ID=MMETSP0484_2-20121128/16393_1 /TAXON_ID=354590 /ORGANISM="Rhodomonas lens, Strain RHODO" /LENGTH=524 /DNA_ID=CAMNT_0019232235 /DNA_START=164 /DNA_END=1738 /DNA_ORIENTATION=-
MRFPILLLAGLCLWQVRPGSCFNLALPAGHVQRAHGTQQLRSFLRGSEGTFARKHLHTRLQGLPVSMQQDPPSQEPERGPKDTFLAFRVDKGPYGFGSITATLATNRTSLELAEDQVWVDLGKHLGGGTFGDVFEAVVVNGPRKGTRAVAKRAKAKRFGQQLPPPGSDLVGTTAMQAQQAWQKEVAWADIVYETAPGFLRVESAINERCASLCPAVVAPFLGAVEQQGECWVLWEHVGAVATLEEILQACADAGSLEPLARGLGVEVSDTRHVINEAATQLLVGCAELQKAGIAHRDIKPSNIIVANHQMLLIDFGAAAVMGAYPQIGYDWNEAPGDAQYCPPERFIDELQWPKYDVYCVALVLLRMLLPPLRSEEGYTRFRTGFRAAGFDIDTWFADLILADPELQTVQGKPRGELPGLGLPKAHRDRFREYERLAGLSSVMRAHESSDLERRAQHWHLYPPPPQPQQPEFSLARLKDGLAAVRNDHVQGLVWDLIHGMLEQEPSLRPTAEEALRYLRGERSS